MKPQRFDWNQLPIFGFFLYAFCLAWRTKGFSYLHVDIGPLPLYVGEFALATMLTWVALRRRDQALTKLKSGFGLALCLFLGFGLLRLLISLFIEKPDTGVVQILRDSALVYQAAWVIVGVSLTRLEIKRLILAALLGAVAAQGEHWIHFLIKGQAIDSIFPELSSPPGSEVVSPLIGLAFALISPFFASVLYAFSGLTLLGIFTVYLKRSWLLAAFLFAAPLQFLGGADAPVGGVRRILAARLVPSLLALALGLGVAVGAEVIVLKRLGKDPSILPSMWSRTYTDLQGWAFHHESGPIKDRNGEATQSYTYMRWRKHLWAQAWEGFVSSPWFGKGFGPHVVTTVFNGYPAIQDGRWISGPHNSYLTVLFRGGILGSLPLLAMLVSVGLSGVRSWALRRFRLGVPELAAAVFLSAAAYAVFNVGLENPHNGNWFWIFLGGWFAMSRETPRNVLVARAPTF